MVKFLLVYFLFQTELIEPALKGTLNVLGSCSKTSSVKRVVVTSSLAAVAFNARPITPEVVIDETWFSDPKLCKEMKVSTCTASVIIRGSKMGGMNGLGNGSKEVFFFYAG